MGHTKTNAGEDIILFFFIGPSLVRISLSLPYGPYVSLQDVLSLTSQSYQDGMRGWTEFVLSPWFDWVMRILQGYLMVPPLSPDGKWVHSLLVLEYGVFASHRWISTYLHYAISYLRGSTDLLAADELGHSGQYLFRLIKSLIQGPVD